MMFILRKSIINQFKFWLYFRANYLFTINYHSCRGK